MKGEPQIIERLNDALFLELGAVNQYWVHYRLLEDWGYNELAKKWREESIERAVGTLKLNAIAFEGSDSLDAPDKVFK